MKTLLWNVYYDMITMKCLLWNMATMKCLLWNVLRWNDYYEMSYDETTTMKSSYDEMNTMKCFTMNWTSTVFNRNDSLYIILKLY